MRKTVRTPWGVEALDSSSEEEEEESDNTHVVDYTYIPKSGNNTTCLPLSSSSKPARAVAATVQEAGQPSNHEAEGGSSPLRDDDEATTIPATPQTPRTPKTPPPSVPEEEEDELSPTPQVPGPSQFPMSPPRRPFMLDEESDLESMAEEVDDEVEIPSFLDLLRRSGRRGRKAREDEEDEEQGSEEGGGDEETEDKNGDESEKEVVKQEEEDQDMYAPEEETNDANGSNDMNVDGADVAQAQTYDVPRSSTETREELSIPPPAQPAFIAKREPMDVKIPSIPPKERKKKKKKKRGEDVDPTSVSSTTTAAPTDSSSKSEDTTPSQRHTADFGHAPVPSNNAKLRALQQIKFRKHRSETITIGAASSTEENGFSAMQDLARPNDGPGCDAPGEGRPKSTIEDGEGEGGREAVLQQPLTEPEPFTSASIASSTSPPATSATKDSLTSTPASKAPLMSASQSTRPRPRPIVSPLKRKRVEIINLDSSDDELATEKGSVSKKGRVEAQGPFTSANGPAAVSRATTRASTSNGIASATVPLAYTRSESHWQLDGSLLVQLDGVRYNLHRSRLVRVCGWFRGVLEDVTRSSVVAGDGGRTSPCKKGEGRKDVKGKGTAKQVEEDSRTKEQEERDLASARRRQRKLREKHLVVVESVEGEEKVIVCLDGLGLGREEWEVFLDCLDDFVRFMNPEQPLPFHTLSAILVVAHVLDAKDYYAWAKRAVEGMWIPSVTSAMSGAMKPVSSHAPFASQVPYASQLVHSQRVQPSPTTTATSDRSLLILNSITPTRIPHAVETVLLARRCGLDEGVLKRALYEVMRRQGFGLGGGGVSIAGKRSRKNGSVKDEDDKGHVDGHVPPEEEEEDDDDCVIIDDPGVTLKPKEREGSEEGEKKVALGMGEVARLVYARSRMGALWSEVLKCGEWDRCFEVGSEGGRGGGGDEPGPLEGGSSLSSKLPKTPRVPASTAKVFRPTPGTPMPRSLLRKFAQASQATASTLSLVSQSQPTTGSQTQSTQGSQSTSQTSQTQRACPGRIPGKVYEIHHRLIISSDLYETFMNDSICGYKTLVSGEVDWEGEGFCPACCDTRREVWTKTCERRWRDLDDLLLG
ncbi:hypothetical protein BKA70DRAFT_1569796 [Coprinopsis sp. MPI-PUGE-AT-0042]|nr:hypothetical protein BKA70DRAFT_1569796 [Coprinopsis sp. MPI-PUGE-AT-0042]